MKVLGIVAIVIASIAASGGAHAQDDSYDGDFYANCLLAKVKPGMDAAAVAAIRHACLRLSIPKKCRDKEHIAGNFFSARAMCASECRDASYFVRTFGSCSIG